MDINAAKNIATSLPFKGNNKEDKHSYTVPFIAGSVALGGTIGALTPERLIIKNSGEVSVENLTELLKNSAEHTKKLTTETANKLTTAMNSALTALKNFADQKQEKPDASMFGPAKLEELQETHFKTLKKLVPTESRLISTARGTAIGGSIALGLVVTGKILNELNPPKDISTDDEDGLPAQSIKYES